MTDKMESRGRMKEREQTGFVGGPDVGDWGSQELKISPRLLA